MNQQVATLGPGYEIPTSRLRSTVLRLSPSQRRGILQIGDTQVTGFLFLYRNHAAYLNPGLGKVQPQREGFA